MPGLMKGLVWKMLAIVEAEEDRKAKTWKSNREKWTNHFRAELGKIILFNDCLADCCWSMKARKMQDKIQKVKKNPKNSCGEPD